MPNFNQIEKKEILRLIQEQNFYDLLRNTIQNIKFGLDWGLIITGKLTYLAKKIIQEGSQDNYKLQIAIRDIRYQSESQDINQLILSLFQSLISVIKIISRHIRDLQKLDNKTSKLSNLTTLAPIFKPKQIVVPPQPQLIPINTQLNLSEEYQEYPISPLSSASLPPQITNKNQIINQSQISDSDSAWEDEKSENEASYDSFYEGGEAEEEVIHSSHLQLLSSDQNLITHNQNLTNSIPESNQQENLINVLNDDALNNKQQNIKQFQQDTATKLQQQNNQIMANVVANRAPKISHQEKYTTIYNSLLTYQNKTIPFDSLEQYNDLREKIVSLRIQSSLSHLNNIISRICNAVQEIFTDGSCLTVMQAQNFTSNKMNDRQLSETEFNTVKALLGIIIKFLSSDDDSILRIEHDEDNMFNRNTLKFKVLGKTAFSLQKDLNRELAFRFKKHLQLKFLSFSTKIFNLNQNLFTRHIPNQPNMVAIMNNPRRNQRRGQQRRQNRAQRNQQKRKFRQQRRHKRKV